MCAIRRTLGGRGEDSVSDLTLQWEDRNAIEQLIYRYSDAVTRADYVQMATVFADDAVRLLKRRGRRARRLEDGFPEWRDAQLPVEILASEATA